MLKSLALPLMKHAARGYVAGDTIEDATNLVQRLSDNGYHATVCYWHESGAPPEDVAAVYRRMIDHYAATEFDVRLSVKIPGLWERKDLFGAVVKSAETAGVDLDIDSHAPAQSDDTFSLCEGQPASVLGVCIPGRWVRSLADAEKAIERGMRVRVVKGSWEDPDHPDRDKTAGFLEVIDTLAGRCRHVGVATHDPELADEALGRLTKAGTPCEHELLFGLPMRPAIEAGWRTNTPTRIYVPFGEAWFPYSLSRAAKDPKLIYRFARDFLRHRDDGVPARP
ncbi:MAG: proline dehydrogenase [Pseudomonadota bacterium]